MSAREPMTVQLYRENTHVQPSLAKDVGDLILGTTTLFLWLVILVLVLA